MCYTINPRNGIEEIDNNNVEKLRASSSYLFILFS